MLVRFSEFWAPIVYRHALLIIGIAAVVTLLAVSSITSLSVSTHLEALMPQDASSVKVLNKALRKAGSFASLQLVVNSESPEQSLSFVKAAKSEIDTLHWVSSSQFTEDIEVLERHKLLLLSLDDLIDLEKDVNEAYPVLMAKKLSESLGTDVFIELRDENMSGHSSTELDDSRLTELNDAVGSDPTTQRYFRSDDHRVYVLVVWPKPGFESLADAKMMVGDTQTVIDRLIGQTQFKTADAGLAGRIANKVAQFDAVMGDLKIGLISAMSLIALLIAFAYRSLVAIPAIIVPLLLGISWTLGLTAVTIGGLNLITVFLALILFGLGIDFGIHNFSRYCEERAAGSDVAEAIKVVIRHTGSASLVAAVTTSIAFFSLTLTEFRAFTEFGFIAGWGINLTFLSMYSVFPALIVLLERAGWRPSSQTVSTKARSAIPNYLNALTYPRAGLLLSAIVCLAFSIFYAPKLPFERNFKNLEAEQPEALRNAKENVHKVFVDRHDRAIVVAETLAEVATIDAYFKRLIETDTQTPTIERISSILDFVPDQGAQKQRLAVIRRLEERANSLQQLDPKKYTSTKRYLSIEDLNIADLPETLRRTYVGTDKERGYLMYVHNSVSMNDSRTARQFYDDAAQFTVNGKTYYSASEGFIFVEMIALMKADALRAILLVISATTLLVYFFLRSVPATLLVLTPPLLGLLATFAIMGALGPPLSIMNMVILPSLVGIAVDNSIHIFHRYEVEGARAHIPEIMGTTGRAAALTTLTTLIGFGGMVTASMGGLRSLGQLAIIGFLSCLAATWVILPILLNWHQSRWTQTGDDVATS